MMKRNMAQARRLAYYTLNRKPSETPLPQVPDSVKVFTVAS